ncbi:MAG: hypothetical protein RMJ28_07975, partial [Nitrososphaerota archaeon]|nr:hypothetical protein [Nitrososphaerota archaeon]
FVRFLVMFENEELIRQLLSILFVRFINSATVMGSRSDGPFNPLCEVLRDRHRIQPQKPNLSILFVRFV